MVPVDPVADVADVVSSLSVVADVDEVDDCCCICISTPRIMLERLGVVLPVRPPSVAAVAVVLVVLVVSDVEFVVFDVVSSFVSRLDRIWDRLPDPCEPMPAMDMVIASFDSVSRRTGAVGHQKHSMCQ
ncbi:hypothetical protein GCM10008942_08120 [Rhizomicrobium electricum]|uniref:Uncharacterized protein n=1 Tax=Rhizomicrobium electricum TaxID=480070 RepID=A0ABP3P8U2_9PROT